LRLAIEVDGAYHRSTFQLGWDLFKSAELESAGLTLLRLTNQEVLGDRARLVARLRRAWRTARENAERTSGARARAPAGRTRASSR
jgi:very-short-patch-repair endonuclease